METEVTVQVPLSEIEVARRRCIVYLKGFVIGYAVAKGFKWTSKRPPSTPFVTARADGAEFSKKMNCDISTVHILYNRLRHQRSHFTNRECEQSHLLKSTKYNTAYNWFVEKVMERTGYGIEVLK